MFTKPDERLGKISWEAADLLLLNSYKMINALLTESSKYHVAHAVWLEHRTDDSDLRKYLFGKRLSEVQEPKTNFGLHCSIVGQVMHAMLSSSCRCKVHIKQVHSVSTLNFPRKLIKLPYSSDG